MKTRKGRTTVGVGWTVIAVTLGIAGVGQADLIEQSRWRLGEGDTAPTAKDSVGTLDLTLQGTAVFTNDVPAGIGSKRSMTYYGQSAPATIHNTGFGFEGWFKLTTSGNHVGLGGANSSWLLWRNTDNKLAYHFPGVALQSSTITPVIGEWFYAALVRNYNSMTYIYYAAAGDTNLTVWSSFTAVAPNPANAGFIISAPYNDEARYFTVGGGWNHNTDSTNLLWYVTRRTRPSGTVIIVR